MAEYTKSTSNDTRYTLRLVVTESNKNTANNTSDITYYLYLDSSFPRFEGWGVTCSLKITGPDSQSVVNYSQTNKNTTMPARYESLLITSGTKTVTHNTIGGGSLSISCSFSTSTSASYLPGSASLSGTYTLSSIPRASTITCKAGKIGGDIEIVINKASKDFTHTLYYKGPNDTVNYWVKDSNNNNADDITSDSFIWRVPIRLYDQIPNSKSAIGTIRCDTYNGSTKIGEKTCSFTANVDEDTNKPTIDLLEIYDTKQEMFQQLTGNDVTLIKGRSNAAYHITASAHNGASIKNITLSCGEYFKVESKNLANKNELIGEYEKVQSGAFDIVVEDSRGFIVQRKISKIFINYFEPTLTITNTTNINGNGEATIILTTRYFTGSFGRCDNTLYQDCKCKEIDEKNYTNNFPSTCTQIDANTFQYKFSSLDYHKTYNFKATAWDLVSYFDEEQNNDFESPEITVNSIPVFDWGKNDFNFNVPLYYQNQPMDFVVEQGTDGIWTYRKWHSGIAECWGRVGSKSYSITSTYGNWFYASGDTISLPSDLFKTITCATSNRCGGTTANGLVTTNVRTISTTSLICFIYDGKSETLDIDVALSVKGTWK